MNPSNSPYTYDELRERHSHAVRFYTELLASKDSEIRHLQVALENAKRHGQRAARGRQRLFEKYTALRQADENVTFLTAEGTHLRTLVKTLNDARHRIHRRAQNLELTRIIHFIRTVYPDLSELVDRLTYDEHRASPAGRHYTTELERRLHEALAKKRVGRARASAVIQARGARVRELEEELAEAKDLAAKCNAAMVDHAKAWGDSNAQYKERLAELETQLTTRDGQLATSRQFEARCADCVSLPQRCASCIARGSEQLRSAVEGQLSSPARIEVIILGEKSDGSLAVAKLLVNGYEVCIWSAYLSGHDGYTLGKEYAEEAARVLRQALGDPHE